MIKDITVIKISEVAVSVAAVVRQVILCFFWLVFLVLVGVLFDS